MSSLDLIFFTGCNHLAQARRFSHPVMISVNAFLKKRGRRYVLRQSPFRVGDWILDSGAFSRISRQYGFKNHLSTLRYASIVRKFDNCGNLLAVVAQDYMVERFILDVTGLDVATHQRLTIHRYDRLKSLLGQRPYIMPVLQGYQPCEYVEHIKQYGARLLLGMWVGVGSVCRRNSRPNAIREVLEAIASLRPDLRLHGFGIKKTALADHAIRALLYSADSQAGGLWDGATGKQRKYEYSNSVAHMEAYRQSILSTPIQLNLFVANQPIQSQILTNSQ